MKNVKNAYASDRARDINETLAAYIRDVLEQAHNFIETDIAHLRAEATNRYLGKPDGLEQEGRSQVVTRDVHDAVHDLLPSLIDIFAGKRSKVTYLPTNEASRPMAAQASEFISHVLREDNDFTTVLYTAFKDALVRKAGFIKWWGEEDVTEHRVDLERQTQEQIMLFVEALDTPDAQASRVDLTPTDTPDVYDASVVVERTVKRLRVGAIPPEEMLISQDTGNMLTSGSVVAHRRPVKATDLMAMGLTRDEIEPHLGASKNDSQQIEEAARTVYDYDSTAYSLAGAPFSEQMALYTEAFLHLDMREDGNSRLYKVCTLGDNYEVVRAYPVSDINIAAFVPDPEPHTFFGQGIADKLDDIQRQRTAVMRGVFDSLAQTLTPSTEVVEGLVNLDDLLNPEASRVVRVSAPNSIRELSTPFVGASALPILDVLDAVKESRTGQTRASAGLNPDALQSSSEIAVSTTVQAAQKRVKMLATLFAESGMRKLYRGVLQLAVSFFDAPRVATLRGEVVAVDPRPWVSLGAVEVDTGFGNGNVSEKIQTLAQIAGKQEQIIQALGPDNGFVGVPQLYNTYKKMVELTEIGRIEEFFVDPASIPPSPPASQTPQPPDANQLLAQVETQKAQLNAQVKQAIAAQNAALKREEMALSDARERDRMQLDLFIEREKLAAQYAYRMQQDAYARADADAGSNAPVPPPQAPSLPVVPEQTPFANAPFPPDLAGGFDQGSIF